MKKFIVIYHATKEGVQQMASVSPEQQKAGMEKWMIWAQKCGENLVDLGAPLMGGTVVESNGKNSNSQKEVTGYSILKAADMNGAMSLLQGHPHLERGGACTIEIHEAMVLSGM